MVGMEIWMAWGYGSYWRKDTIEVPQGKRGRYGMCTYNGRCVMVGSRRLFLGYITWHVKDVIVLCAVLGRTCCHYHLLWKHVLTVLWQDQFKYASSVRSCSMRIHGSGGVKVGWWGAQVTVKSGVLAPCFLREGASRQYMYLGILWHCAFLITMLCGCILIVRDSSAYHSNVFEMEVHSCWHVSF